MRTLYFAILLLALPFLTSCGSKEKSVDLEVSTGLAISSAGFTGGLIAYGETSDGKKFNASATTGVKLTVTIPDGEWKIYVMGWENTNDLPFRGTKYCGMKTVNFDSNTLSTTININTTNCSDPTLNADISIQNLMISSCGGFYQYVPTTDTYMSPSSSNEYFCSTLPAEMTYQFPFYKIISPNPTTPGITTECISAKFLATDGANTRFMLPTKKFPFKIRGYKSLADCQDTTGNVKFANFQFPNGIQAGDFSSFDSHFSVDSSNAPDARLILPSSLTRRGYTPFINSGTSNKIPRTICGPNTTYIDCVPNPTTPAMITIGGANADFLVDWSGNSHDDAPILIRGVKPSYVTSTCDAPVLAFLKSSPYFSFENCQIEEGNLKANIKRNALSCQESGFYFSLVYEKNGLIYAVSGTNIYIYNKDGVELKNIPTSAGSILSVAVDALGNIYTLTSSSGETITKYVWNESTKMYDQTSINSATYSTISGAVIIEAGEANVLYAYIPSPGSIKKINFTSPGTVINTATTTISSTNYVVDKFQYKNGFLYVTYLNSDYTLFKYLPDLSSPSQVYSATGAIRYHLIDSPVSGQFYWAVYFSTTNTVYIKSSDFSTVVASSLASSGTTSAMAGVGSKIYLNFSSNLDMFTLNNSTLTKTAKLTSTCEGQLTGTLAGASQTINLLSKSNLNTTIHATFEDAFQFIGRRNVNKVAKLYFSNLRSKDDEDDHRELGPLRRVQEMLGPTALGGMMAKEFPAQTCEQIRSQVAIPFTKSITLNEVFSNETMTASLKLSQATLFSVNALKIEFAQNSDHFEKMEITVACNGTVFTAGDFESFESEDGKISKEKITWKNPQDVNGFFEHFESQYENSWIKHVASRFEKSTVNIFVLRNLLIERRPSEVKGDAIEIYNDGTNISRAQSGTTQSDSTNFQENTSVVSTEYIASGGVCMTTGNTSPSVALFTAGCNNFGSALTFYNSFDPPSLSQIESSTDTTSGTGNSITTSFDEDIFTIDP